MWGNHSLGAKEWFPRAPFKKADWIGKGYKKIGLLLPWQMRWNTGRFPLSQQS